MTAPAGLVPCEYCPWRRDTRHRLSRQQILAMRHSCGTRGHEAPLSAPMIACIVGGGQQRPCTGWLAAHGADHLGVRLRATFGGVPAEALHPRPDWPATYPTLDDLALGHTGLDLHDLASEEVEPDLNVHDEATGKARLLSRRCDTCILRPGDLMHLGTDRLRHFLNQVRSADSFVICHQTLPGMCDDTTLPAICRGFFDRYRTTGIDLAASWGFQEVPPPDATHQQGPGTKPATAP
jgi:hypothetical protein